MDAGDTMITKSAIGIVASVALGAVAIACGGSLMDEPLEKPERSVAPSAVTAVPAPPAKPVTTLAREDVDKAVRAGLGYFLQHGSVEPVIVADKFQGFRVVDLRPAEYWAGVDLKPGDVVRAVNGMPIERDIDAYNAFQSLLRARELRVSLLRDGRGREIVLPITGAPKTSPKTGGDAGPAPTL